MDRMSFGQVSAMPSPRTALYTSPKAVWTPHTRHPPHTPQAFSPEWQHSREETE